MPARRGVFNLGLPGFEYLEDPHWYHVYTCKYALYMYIYIYVAYVHAYVRARTHTQTHTDTHRHTQTHTDTHTHTHPHTHTHTCLYATRVFKDEAARSFGQVKLCRIQVPTRCILQPRFTHNLQLKFVGPCRAWSAWLAWNWCD